MNKTTKIIVVIMMIVIVGYICTSLIKNDMNSTKEIVPNISEESSSNATLYDFKLESGENDISIAVIRKWRN